MIQKNLLGMLLLVMMIGNLGAAAPLPAGELPSSARPAPHGQEIDNPPLDENGNPRPPSEAGQNIVLVFGAAMLVAILFFGVAINLRRGKSSTKSARTSTASDH